jgi:short-subunit dehydrogenase
VKLHGATVVVTGASAGIGRATALAFARQGATVVAAARREERLRELVAEIEQRGGRGLAVRCDVSEPEDIDDLRAKVEAAYGRCDVLVNNAGIPGGGRFTDLTVEQIERIVRVDYLGVLYCTKAFLPMMLRAGRGHIVNVASLAGRFATPGASVYASAKHAVVAFSEALHFEVAPQGVSVTTVNPGFVSTEGFPYRNKHTGHPARWLLRVMRPQEVAEAIVGVVKSGKAPEVSVPRWPASLQAVRVLAPPVYRAVLRRVASSGRRPTAAPKG